MKNHKTQQKESIDRFISEENYLSEGSLGPFIDKNLLKEGNIGLKFSSTLNSNIKNARISKDNNERQGVKRQTFNPVFE